MNERTNTDFAGQSSQPNVKINRKDVSMRFTIARKVYAVGAFSLLALAILGGIGLTTASSVINATTQNEMRQADVSLANDMLIAQARLNLAAMDSIVKKDDGKVAPEILEQISKHAAFLKKNAAKLTAAANTREERKLTAGLAAQIKSLAQVIRVDLVEAIETGADAVEFGRLDDVIDKLGSTLESHLNVLEESFYEEGQEALLAARSAAEFSRTGSIVAFLISGILLTVVLVLLGRSIVNPITKMTRSMMRLSDGDKTTKIPAVGRQDEVGEMAGAVQVFKDNMIKADELAEEQRREHAEREERAKRIEDLCKAFDATSSKAVKSVAAASHQMQSSSESMNATAEEATRQSAAVAAASEQASANVQTVATAAEELSASISEISRQVSQASQIASGAVQQAEQTNIKIQGLAEAANKIGEVVALITDIADQTNLLALNATIEAARAGDAGKGFAVVASEVKNLANQTAKATDEIGAQITGIQTATREAVTAIGEIGKTISEIDQINSGIASAVEEQGAATQEIARNVEQAATGTHEVSSNIGGVSQAADDTGAAASQIRSAADDLSRQSEALRTEVDSFLKNVQAA